MFSFFLFFFSEVLFKVIIPTDKHFCYLKCLFPWNTAFQWIRLNKWIVPINRKAGWSYLILLLINFLIHNFLWDHLFFFILWAYLYLSWMCIIMYCIILSPCFRLLCSLRFISPHNPPLGTISLPQWDFCLISLPTWTESVIASSGLFERQGIGDQLTLTLPLILVILGYSLSLVSYCYRHFHLCLLSFESVFHCVHKLPLVLSPITFYV